MPVTGRRAAWATYLRFVHGGLMAMTETGLTHEAAIAVTSSDREETLTDRLMAFTAMGGAVVGALAGTVLGTEAGGAFPAVCGALGTMLGSGLAAGAWCAVADLCRNLFVRHEDGHARARAAAEQRFVPAPGA